jgi:uncharacterized protein YecE (DUF72 family)
VEINNTFYQMPKTAVLENWAKRRRGFRFAIKASRRITHMARLKARHCSRLCRISLQESQVLPGEARTGPVSAAAVS